MNWIMGLIWAESTKFGWISLPKNLEIKLMVKDLEGVCENFLHKTKDKNFVYPI